MQKMFAKHNDIRCDVQKTVIFLSCNDIIKKLL